jgi:hypothetical protein
MVDTSEKGERGSASPLAVMVSPLPRGLAGFGDVVDSGALLRGVAGQYGVPVRLPCRCARSASRFGFSWFLSVQVVESPICGQHDVPGLTQLRKAMVADLIRRQSDDGGAAAERLCIAGPGWARERETASHPRGPLPHTEDRCFVCL